MTQPPYWHPGYGMPPPPGRKPDNNLVWGILVTVMCCMPLGVVSLIKASQVDSLWNQGRFQEAVESAEQAKKWAMWGAIIAAVGTVLAIIGYVVFLAVTIGVVESTAPR